MGRVHWAAGLALAVATIQTFAAEATKSARPASGPWKDEAPGAFVIFNTANYDTRPNLNYRREMLLGVDNEGRAVIDLAEGPDVIGPWTPKARLAKTSDDLGGEAIPLGRRDVEVDGHAVACEGQRFEKTTDKQVITVEQWTDIATGRRVRTLRTSISRDPTAKEQQVQIEDVLVKLEDRRVGSIDVPAAVYSSTTVTDGVLRMSRRTAISDRIPGGRISYQRWVGVEGIQPPSMDEQVVATGEAPEEAAALSGLKPPVDVPQTQPNAP